ncbi:MAG: hypothetical protein QW652_01010, partial [Candidatus Nitrosotenuis sp.]
RFSIQGGLREAFNEQNWTDSYNKFDNLFKLKYGIKLISGGFRKHTLKEIDTYRKASLFWTRNPKLVNPMKEKRVWVQVAKNFEPFIKLTEDDVRAEMFDFDEKITIKASQLGEGKHKIGAEVYASWQKHHFTDPDSVKAESKEIEVTIK